MPAILRRETSRAQGICAERAQPHPDPLRVGEGQEFFTGIYADDLSVFYIDCPVDDIRQKIQPVLGDENRFP